MKTTISLIVIVCFAFACKKVIPEQLLAIENKPIVQRYRTISANYSESLDWNNQVYPWQNGSILSPFAGGTTREFPSEYLIDKDESDGWALYSNTFSSNSSINSKKYFALYNRYRGLLRIYYYYDGPPAATKNIIWNLSLDGLTKNSNSLNFEQGALIDLNTNLLHTTKVQPNKKVQPYGCWYAEEFEIAYDPNIYTQPYNANTYSIGFYAQDVSPFNLPETQDPFFRITSQIPMPLTGTAWPDIINSTLNITNSSLEALNFRIAKSILTKSANSDSLFNQAEKSLIQDLRNSGIVKKETKSVFNAIIGKNASGTHYRNDNFSLKFNTVIKTRSGSSTPTGLGNINFLIPKTKELLSISSGILPLYNKKLGIFNISGKPKVKRQSTYKVTNDSMIAIATVTASYQIDQQSFSINWNDDLFNNSAQGATYENLKKELVLIDPRGLGFNRGHNTEFLTINGEALKTYVISPSSDAIYFVREFPSSNGATWYPLIKEYGVRISFDVVPNNGSGRYTIIKTFKAELN